jgi:hypothetical protein
LPIEYSMENMNLSRRAESLCLTVAEGDVAALARLYPLSAEPV